MEAGGLQLVEPDVEQVVLPVVAAPALATTDLATTNLRTSARARPSRRRLPDALDAAAVVGVPAVWVTAMAQVSSSLGRGLLLTLGWVGIAAAIEHRPGDT